MSNLGFRIFYFCVCAGVIFKGKRFKSEFKDDLPPGSIVRMAPKGYMTTELLIDFIKSLASFKPPGEIILVYDDAKYHLDITIPGAADEHDIILYRLPFNTSHDTVYRSFEHHWDTELLQCQAEHSDRKTNKTSYNKILTRVWSKRMTNSNLTNGFKTVGIYLFNPDAIPETAFSPSVLTERSSNIKNSENQNTPNIIPEGLQSAQRNTAVNTEESSDTDDDRPLA